jgi:poly-gamma-glutamate synthesis protein (capsule biosynthesis protein)
MRQYATRGVISQHAPHTLQAPEMARLFTDCGFDAITGANNHMYDSGVQAMLDTRAFFLSKGIQVTGFGRDLNEARQAAILERHGVTVAYLGCSAVTPPGGEAGVDKPGIASLHINTQYEHRGPHADVRIRTTPDATDLERLLGDIRALKRKVDIVIPALHYGVLWVPRVISDYQVTVAHACVDAGADMVVGHAPHIPKAIEVYKGKVIFYSIGAFSMTKPFPSPSWSEPPWAHGAVRNHTDQDPDYPLLPYGQDAQRSLLAKAVATKHGIERVSFLPLRVNRQYQPEALRAGDERFAEAVRYMDWASDGFDHRFAVDGDEVIVKAA